MLLRVKHVCVQLSQISAKTPIENQIEHTKALLNSFCLNGFTLGFQLHN